ncbi:NAD(P)-binding domain-containing protein, partial [Arthrobacter globiformis]|uniref:NAD(P)-binding domain-containing protein n=1 Tax=Arthrobacter globiformis TaxID=1665 RepID=UPI0011250F11
MRISVIGCGYLGAVHAACMAKLGHDVIGVDVDEYKVKELSAARAPFFEPGLEDLLDDVQQNGSLTFTTDMSKVADCDVHFICVGTPQKKGENAADMTFVDAAATSLLPHLQPGSVVVGKSTVPVGTASRLSEQVARQQPSAHLLWNPEFLREGHAVADTLSPDRFVYGVIDGSE